MISVIGKESACFPSYGGSGQAGDAVLVECEGISAYEARLACERIKNEGGWTLVRPPEIFSPVLAGLCDVALLCGSSLERITGIRPDGEAYLCLALKKLYGLGVKRAVIFLEEETVFADGLTVKYEKATTEEETVKRCVRLLVGGRSITED